MDFSCDGRQPNKKPDKTHVSFLLPSGSVPNKGAPAGFYAQVCGKSGVGAINTRFQYNQQPGCLTAKAMCCEGPQPQCMLYADKNHNVSPGVSNVGQILVPCGVKVVGTYDTSCNPNASNNEVRSGDNNVYQFPSSQKSGTLFPYSFQISLEDGYKCDSNDNVVTLDGKPCDADPGDAPIPHAPPNVVKPFSNQTIAIGVIIIGGIIIALAVALRPTAQPQDLTVDQIVAHAGVNRHLVAPRARVQR